MRDTLVAVLFIRGCVGQAIVDDDAPVVKCDLTKHKIWDLKNGKLMKEAEDECRVSLNKLRLDISGKHGPVTEESIWEVMCSPACTQNDFYHQQAMKESGCNCEQLSATYSNLEADFCSANSARMLCKQYKPLFAVGSTRPKTKLWAGRLNGRSSKGALERCGTWNCRLGDYMCPRYEWDRMWICNSSQARSPNLIVTIMAMTLSFFMYQQYA